MHLLDPCIHDTRNYIETKKKTVSSQVFKADRSITWPKSESSGLVLMPDLAVELGSPDLASVSFQTWTPDGSLVNDETISIIGSDISKTCDPNLPFGKIIIAQVEGFNENNAAERTREMFLSKFDLSLNGFMLKSASNYMAEWCRISVNAIDNNFSFQVLGSSLINELKKLDYVKSVEIIFVTSSKEDVNQLFEIGNRSVRIVNAMSKMVNEMNYDCGDCEFQDICEDAEELREIRDNLAYE
jgi:CO dehydrogenase/acetyl-CoA synthase beta subunit